MAACSAAVASCIYVSVIGSQELASTTVACLLCCPWLVASEVKGGTPAACRAYSSGFRLLLWAMAEGLLVHVTAASGSTPCGSLRGPRQVIVIIGVFIFGQVYVYIYIGICFVFISTYIHTSNYWLFQIHGQTDR